MPTFEEISYCLLQSMIEVKTTLDTKMEDGNVTGRCVRGFAIPSAIFRLVNLVVLIIAVCSWTFVSTGREPDRRLLILVHRDGKHNPAFNFPSDEYRRVAWPEGPGGLNKKGAEQLCNLGRAIHFRYRELFPFPDSYTSENIRVISSSVERCIIGVHNLLICLPSELLIEDKLKKEFIEQQVVRKKFKADKFINYHFETHTISTDIIPKVEDNILLQSRSCPKYDEMLQDMRPTFNKEHTDLFATVSQHVGETITDYVRMGQIYDTLISQFSNGLSFPKWASKMHPMFDKFRISTNLLATNTPYMKRIRAGPLAANIVSLMRQKCEGKMAHNVTIYSGKESTLVDLGEAMQFQYRFKGLANSGAAFAFELFEVGTICDTWNVEIVYYEHADTKYPAIVPIEGCTSPCTLQELDSVVKKLWTSAEDYEAACKK